MSAYYNEIFSNTKKDNIVLKPLISEGAIQLAGKTLYLANDLLEKDLPQLIGKNSNIEHITENNIGKVLDVFSNGNEGTVKPDGGIYDKKGGWNCAIEFDKDKLLENNMTMEDVKNKYLSISFKYKCDLTPTKYNGNIVDGKITDMIPLNVAIVKDPKISYANCSNDDDIAYINCKLNGDENNENCEKDEKGENSGIIKIVKDFYRQCSELMKNNNNHMFSMEAIANCSDDEVKEVKEVKEEEEEKEIKDADVSKLSQAKEEEKEETEKEKTEKEETDNTLASDYAKLEMRYEKMMAKFDAFITDTYTHQQKEENCLAKIDVALETLLSKKEEENKQDGKELGDVMDILGNALPYDKLEYVCKKLGLCNTKKQEKIETDEKQLDNNNITPTVSSIFR